MTMKEIRTVTENWTAELKSMKVGDVLAFPLEKYSSIQHNSCTPQAGDDSAGGRLEADKD